MNIYILRAGSGAGKSTWTKNNHPDAVVLSADDFFMVGGEYRFDPAKLGAAHGECLRDFVRLCQLNDPSLTSAPAPCDVAIVDNTNTTLSEFGPYAQVGLAYGHNVSILTFIYDPVLAQPGPRRQEIHVQDVPPVRHKREEVGLIAGLL